MRTRISHGGFSGAGCSISPRTGAPACSRLRISRTTKAGCKPALRPMSSRVQRVKGFGEFSPRSFTHRRHFSHGLEDCAATVPAVSSLDVQLSPTLAADSPGVEAFASTIQASSRTAEASTSAIQSNASTVATSASAVKANGSTLATAPQPSGQAPQPLRQAPQSSRPAPKRPRKRQNPQKPAKRGENFTQRRKSAKIQGFQPPIFLGVLASWREKKQTSTSN
jgi:hypothetical protein